MKLLPLEPIFDCNRVLRSKTKYRSSCVLFLLIKTKHNPTDPIFVLHVVQKYTALEIRFLMVWIFFFFFIKKKTK